MKQRAETITVTLHWLGKDGEQSANILCEDSPPAQLIPLLLAGCGLAPAGQGDAERFLLRLGGANGRALLHSERASTQGVRNGMHLWLAEHSRHAARRCILVLPGEGELLLPAAGATLTRAWLLQALALLDPERHLREVGLLERRESPYRYVSNRPHCRVAPVAAGGWAVSTDRADVATLRNGLRLSPALSVPLCSGDRLTLGEGGLGLGVVLLRD